MNGKIIKLSNGMKTIVDAEDYPVLSRFNWHFSGHGYAVVNFYGKTIPLHKFLNPLIPGRMDVDHKNRNKLDNRKENYRHIPRTLNAQNRNGIRGATFCPGRKKPWRSQARFMNKQYTIGYFKTKKEAAVAYDDFTLKMRGKEGKLNYER